MRFSLFRAGIVSIAVIAAWLLAGRRLVLALDRLLTIRHTSLPISPLYYDGGGFVIGSIGMAFGSVNNLRWPLDLTRDSQNRVVLSTGGKSFALGAGARTPSRDIEFSPEPGDKVSFVSSQSVIGWPTPFEYHIMMRSPRWKRYVYYRFCWEKQDGAKLRMVWRFEQQYYSPGGWTEPQMMWNSQTGLLKVEIN